MRWKFYYKPIPKKCPHCGGEVILVSDPPRYYFKCRRCMAIAMADGTGRATTVLRTKTMIVNLKECERIIAKKCKGRPDASRRRNYLFSEAARKLHVPPKSMHYKYMGDDLVRAFLDYLESLGEGEMVFDEDTRTYEIT